MLLAFQVGDDPRHLTEAFGRAVSLTFHRLQPNRIAELLGQAGLVPYARMLREPEGELETTQQAYLLALKPADAHHDA